MKMENPTKRHKKMLVKNIFACVEVLQDYVMGVTQATLEKLLVPTFF
jgi:hypothetical protein